MKRDNEKFFFDSLKSWERRGVGSFNLIFLLFYQLSLNFLLNLFLSQGSLGVFPIDEIFVSKTLLKYRKDLLNVHKDNDIKLFAYTTLTLNEIHIFKKYSCFVYS